MYYPGLSRARFVATLVLALLLAAPATQAQVQIRLPATIASELDTVLSQARELETQRRWGEALNLYEEFARKNPGQAIVDERLDLAKIHYDLGRRYSDSSFRKTVRTLSESEALDLYSQVMSRIYTHYVSPPNWKSMVERGTLDLSVALYEPQFAEFNLPNITADQLVAFRRQLQQLTATTTCRDRNEARDLVARAARLAQGELGISPTAVVLEYVAGAMGGLDEYSTFLTTGQLGDLYSQIDGNFVGLGVELKARDNALLIVNTIPGSPADKAGIRKNDRVIGVAGRTTKDLTTDQAADLLQGEAGTSVELLIQSGHMAPRRMVVRREHVEVPSVESAQLIDRESGIGYLKLTCFQKTTSADLDAAMWSLHRQGMKSLVIDLRGNPGGLLTSSVEIADKFLDEGNIVSTRGRSAQEDFNYTAHKAGTWRVPLVVLIDGESASASEIFAGAMRDHRRATIVGVRSYGKGSVQGIFPLTIAGTGLRLTTSKFYSPNGHPYSRVGVEPNVVVRTVAKPLTELVPVDTLAARAGAGDSAVLQGVAVPQTGTGATATSQNGTAAVNNGANAATVNGSSLGGAIAAEDGVSLADDATLAAGLQAARRQVASVK